jgi:hypothetical protein
MIIVLGLVVVMPRNDGGHVVFAALASQFTFEYGKSIVIAKILRYRNFLGAQFSAWFDDTEGDVNGCTVEVGSAPSAPSLSLTEL